MWKPIDTAPMDVPILVCGCDLGGKLEMAVLSKYAPFKGWDGGWHPHGIGGWEYEIEIEPQFWTELPEAPK